MPAPDEQAISDTEADWIAFSSLDRMKSHWDRPGWWPGRSAYYWYLTFSGESKLQEIAATCQSKINAPYFDLVPLSDLHMTLERVAFEDEIEESELSRVTSAAQEACQEIAPLRIRVGPLAGSSGAISFSASPYADLARLRDILHAATKTALHSNPSIPDGLQFRPHIGIAYCNGEVAAAPIIGAVQALRKLPIIEAVVKTASLVALTREQNAYRWVERRRVALNTE